MRTQKSRFIWNHLIQAEEDPGLIEGNAHPQLIFPIEGLVKTAEADLTEEVVLTEGAPKDFGR